MSAVNAAMSARMAGEAGQWKHTGAMIVAEEVNESTKEQHFLDLLVS